MVSYKLDDPKSHEKSVFHHFHPWFVSCKQKPNNVSIALEFFLTNLNLSGARVVSFRKGSPLLVVRLRIPGERVLGKRWRWWTTAAMHIFRGCHFPVPPMVFRHHPKQRTQRSFCIVSHLSSYQGSANHEMTAIANAMRPKPRAKKIKKKEKKWWDRGPCFFFWQLSMPEQTIKFHWIYNI